MDSKKKISIAIVTLSILTIGLAVFFIMVPDISPISDTKVKILIAVIGFLGVILSEIIAPIITAFFREKNNEPNVDKALGSSEAKDGKVHVEGDKNMTLNVGNINDNNKIILGKNVKIKK